MGAKQVPVKTWTPPETQDTTSLRNWKYQRDPRIPHIYQNAKQEFAESYKNPFGAYTTPMVRDQAIRANNLKLDQAYSQASMQENAMANNAEFNQKSVLANLTRPQMYMPQYRENPWMTGLGIAAGVAGNALGAF